jgi:two-component system OmpR family sensor kinase
MSLRVRLIVSFTALLLAAIAAVGVVASRSVRSVLTAQIDQRLTEIVSRGPRPGGILLTRDGPFPSSIALVFAGGDGTVLAEQPSGFSDDPDPLPQIAAVPEDATGFMYLPAVEGSLEYRALVAHAQDGSLAVLAAPLRELQDATSRLIRTLGLAGGGVLLLGAAGTWWTVRRSLRPVDRMVDTAAAIAGGDLTRRVPDTDTSTELGRLGDALNEMLAHIEQAIAAERDAQERLRRFVADASHELRTPVAAIAGYTELRRRGGLADPKDLDRALNRIEAEARRMQHLVEDLLLLARLDQTQPLERATVDLTNIVTDAIADHRAIDPDRPITLNSSGSAMVLGDNGRLTQVLGNLLSNARVHTPPGTPVSVEIRRHDSQVTLEITDEGPGFPAASLDRVFERFYRVDPSRTRKTGGSGLGLAIVAAIVAAHGGTVSATNPPGHGARVSVTLPATD